MEQSLFDSYPSYLLFSIKLQKERLQYYDKGSKFQVILQSEKDEDLKIAAGAMWMLAMLWFSPLTRHYYLALALPALAVVWRAMVTEYHRNGERPNGDTKLGLVALLAWGVGIACLGWNAGRWYGLHLGVLLILAIATGRAWQKAIRTPGASEAESILSVGDEGVPALS